MVDKKTIPRYDFKNLTGINKMVEAKNGEYVFMKDVYSKINEIRREWGAVNPVLDELVKRLGGEGLQTPLPTENENWEK